jgi:hypothetical protein
MELVILSLILFSVAAVLAWRDHALSGRLEVLDRPAPARAVDVRKASSGDVIAISGTARADDHLVSKYTLTPCIYFSSTKERQVVSPQVVGQLHSGFGISSRSRRRDRRHSYWETVETYRQAMPFFIENGTGRIPINPDGTNFDAKEVLNRDESGSIGDSFLLSGGITSGTGGSIGGQRYAESVIPVDTEVSVLGVVDNNGGLGRYDGRSELFISYRTADGLRKHLERRTRLYFFGAIAAGSAGVILAALGISGMIG